MNRGDYMLEKNNAKCTVCGKDYHMCLSCKDKMRMSPWKMYTDSAEHYKIHQIIHGYSTKVYTEDEVRDKLKNVDLSDLEDFKPHIKQIIKDILKEEKLVVKSVDIVEETVDAEAAMEKRVAIEKPAYSRKRNYKVNNEVEVE